MTDFQVQPWPAVMVFVAAEVERQDRTHSGYPVSRDGIRSGLAAIEDETREALEAWRSERCKCPTPACSHSRWTMTRQELAQVAAVAIRTMRSIDLAELGRETATADTPLSDGPPAHADKSIGGLLNG